MWQIKENYQHRQRAEAFEDVEHVRVHQPHVYEFAHYLCERLDAKYVIEIGCRNGEKLRDFPESVQRIGIDQKTNLNDFEQNNPGAMLFEVDLESGIPDLSEEIIRDSVVICTGVLGSLQNPDNLLKYLSFLSHHAMFTLVATPDRTRLRGIGDFGPPHHPRHLREWGSEELHTLFTEYQFKPGFWGFSTNNNELLDKTTTLYIGGRFNGFSTAPTPNLRAVAVMSVHNEEDVAMPTIKYYLSQGLHVHVIDNWSDNGIYERILDFSATTDKLTIERFPAEEKDDQFRWKEIVDRKAAYAMESGFDWAFHVDADELRCSPWPGTTLLEGIAIVDALGFNAIDHTVLEFRPTKPGFKAGVGLKRFFHHFEFAQVRGAFLQIKGWKMLPDTEYDLSKKGGHEVSFSGRKVYPLKFENQHFAYRSLEQMEEKLGKERLQRFSEEIEKYKWHLHLPDFISQHGIELWDAEDLLPDSPLTRANYLVERLSGVGILRHKLDPVKNTRLYSLLVGQQAESEASPPVGNSEQAQRLQNRIRRLEEEITEIKNTRSWRLMERLSGVRKAFVSAEAKIKSIFGSKR